MTTCRVPPSVDYATASSYTKSAARYSARYNCINTISSGLCWWELSTIVSCTYRNINCVAAGHTNSYRRVRTASATVAWRLSAAAAALGAVTTGKDLADEF